MASPGFNLTAAKARLSIVGTGSDVAIQLALDTTMQVVETYLDRGINLRLAYSQDHFQTPTGTIQNWLYPIIAVNSVVDNDATAANYTVDHDAGIFYFDFYEASKKFTTDVDGGWDFAAGTGPLDIEQALWAVFDKVWAATSTGAGAAASNIKTIRAGQLSVTYDTNAANAGAGAGFVDGIAVALLDPYRRLTA